MTTSHQQTDVHESITKQDRNNINDPQKKRPLGTVSRELLQVPNLPFSYYIWSVGAQWLSDRVLEFGSKGS